MEGILSVYFLSLSVLHNAFVILAPDYIFTCVGLQCYCWGSERFFFNCHSFFCDTLEEFHQKLEVVPIVEQEFFVVPISSPL